MTIVPIEGRDYKSKAAVLEDFMADKDFVVQDMSSQWDGKRCNRTSLEKGGENRINVRYQGLRKVAVLRRKGETWVS